jgi:hypothetical protein
VDAALVAKNAQEPEPAEASAEETAVNAPAEQMIGDGKAAGTAAEVSAAPVHDVVSAPAEDVPSDGADYEAEAEASEQDEEK